MALIEGFRVRNYRALRDVTLGKLSTDQKGEPLTPFTVVIGKNGAGKSTLFDAFGFVADCLSSDIEAACDAKQRGGFERMRSLGVSDPIRFEIYYREAKGERPITYELAINLDASDRPFVELKCFASAARGKSMAGRSRFCTCNMALERCGPEKKPSSRQAARKTRRRRTSN
jgi:predicted ATPase